MAHLCDLYSSAEIASRAVVAGGAAPALPNKAGACNTTVCQEHLRSFLKRSCNELQTIETRMAPQQIVAKVWTLLQTRVDIESILRELLGHFTLSSVGGISSPADSFDLLVWVKIILDLQRTYSQSSEPSLESISCLLPQRVLFTTIHHVLETRLQLYSPQRSMDQEHLAQRHFAARVLLSGLRALQLRGKLDDSFALEGMGRVSARIQEWFVDAEGHASEQFILSKCRAALFQIRRGPGPDDVWHKPARGTCELRDQSKELYEALTTKVRTAFEEGLGLLLANDEDAFWALFDILWAAEAGYTQWCADRLSGKPVFDYKNELSSLTEKMEGMTPEWCMVLKHNWCDNSQAPDPLQSTIEASLAKLHLFLLNRRSKLVDYDLEIKKLSTELQQRVESWIRQESGYRDEVLREEGQAPLETAYVLRCPQLHVVPEHELRSRISPDKHDIFNNPQLLKLEAHPIDCPRCPQRLTTTVVTNARMIEPLQYLSGRLRQLTETSNTSQIPENLRTAEPSTTPQSSQAPRASWASQSSHGSQDSEAVQNISSARYSRGSHSSLNSQNPGLVRHSTANHPISVEPFSDSDMEPPLPLTLLAGTLLPRSPRRVSTGSQSTSTTPSVNENRSIIWKGPWFGRGSGEKQMKAATVATPKVKPRSGFQSYCFSADGKMLILWNRFEECVYTSIIPSQDSAWIWNKFKVMGVAFMSGGGNRVAVVSKGDNQYTLQVFAAPANPAANEPIWEKALQQNGQVRSIAMSLDGDFVAVGSDRDVFVYDVNNSRVTPRKIMLSNNANVNSQRINFSRDGNKVVIATRKLNGQVEIILFDRLDSQEAWPRINTKEQEITDQDHGLSAVFYDGRSRKIVMTGYINKHYNIVQSETRASVPWDARSGKIQSAVACASGSQYKLLTGNGELFRLDLDHQMAPERLTPVLNLNHPPRSSAQFVALAAPENNCIYSFRIEQDTMIFEVIIGQNMPVRRA